MKGDGHGAGAAGIDGPAVPLRRWEDWERSRLRKLRREEKRRREFERAHPSGYIAGEGDLLSARGDVRSQYDGSDTYSVASSDDDHWGPQIGGYNENNAQYPPPPVGLMPHEPVLQSAKVVGGAELEAMLEMGFDDAPSPLPTAPPPNNVYAPRYQLTDGSTTNLINGYTPVSRSASPGGGRPPNHSIPPTTPNTITSVSERGGRDGGRPGPTERGKYGPLGPLDPGARF